MKLNLIQKTAGLLLASLLTAGTYAQTSITGDVPASVSGTYTLRYTALTSPAAPYATNTTKTFVIDGAADTLCVDGKSLGTAYKRTAASTVMLWTDSANSVAYELSVTSAGALNEINVYTPNDTATNFKGQFGGSRTSTSTTCASATPISITTDAQAVFDLAAELYPTLFVNGTELREYQGYTYKFFASSGIYVGIKDGSIFLMGGQFGSTPKAQGTIAAVKTALTTAKANQQNNNNNNNNNNNSNSLYDLTVSGKFNTSGIFTTSITIPAITLLDVPAPGANDHKAFEDAVKSMGASSISGLSVQLINNSSARITYRVQFNATLTGFGNVSYDLTYDYVQ